MILLALLLFAVGLFFSAFFSGSETGFYRVSRIRLVMDAMEGNRVAKCLLYLWNRPPLFIATALVGNNSANYLTSLSIIIGCQVLLGSHAAVEMLASLLLSPLIFVYGELLPKNLFYKAPNRLLFSAGPLFTLFAILFAPVSAVLWGLGKLLESLIGESPDKVRLTLARKELDQVLLEGEDLGILHPSQRFLAQNFLLLASKLVRETMTPMAKLVCIDAEATATQAIRAARKHGITEIAVTKKNSPDPIGYLRCAELLIATDSEACVAGFCRPLIDLPADELHGEALIQLYASRERMARIVDPEQSTLGVVSLPALVEPLLGGPLAKLQSSSA